MLIDAEILCIKEWADKGTPQCQLLMFWFCARGNKVNANHNQAIKYLIDFLQNKPSECIDAIYMVGEIEDAFDGKEKDLFNYIYYVTVVGIFLKDELPLEASLWFKKAITLAEEQLKFRDERTKELFRQKISAYQYWPEFRKYFNESAFNNFNLKWEQELYFPSNLANQNSDAYT